MAKELIILGVKIDTKVTNILVLIYMESEQAKVFITTTMAIYTKENF